MDTSFSRITYEEVSMNSAIKLIALPCLCVDVFDASGEIRPGGEALNFAAHASGFEGIDVTLLGALGADEYAQVILDSIAHMPIHTESLRREPDKHTANNRVYLTPEGDRYYKEDSWDGDIVDKMILNEKELRLLSESDVVFIHFWAGCFPQVLEAKKRYGFLLAVDFDVYRDFEKMQEYAPYVDYFMISGKKELLPYFEAFSRRYPGLFNMSLAEKGSVTYQNGICYRVSACEVPEVIDTTGCGDSYHAGFVCSHLLHKDIRRAMQEGSRLAAGTLSHFGGY